MFFVFQSQFAENPRIAACMCIAHEYITVKFMKVVLETWFIEV